MDIIKLIYNTLFNQNLLLMENQKILHKKLLKHDVILFRNC